MIFSQFLSLSVSVPQAMSDVSPNQPWIANQRKTQRGTASQRNFTTQNLTQLWHYSKEQILYPVLRLQPETHSRNNRSIYTRIFQSGLASTVSPWQGLCALGGIFPKRKAGEIWSVYCCHSSGLISWWIKSRCCHRGGLMWLRIRWMWKTLSIPIN